MKQFRVLTAAALFGFGLVLGVSSSWADAVTFPDIPAGASDGLFSVGLGAINSPQFTTEPAAETTREDVKGLIFPGDFTGAVNLTDPGTGAVSDMIFTQPGSAGGTTVLLVSDPFPAPASPTVPTPTLTETGSWQDISSYFGLHAESLFAFSDLDTPVETPEPTTLALLGTGLLGLVMMRRRRTRGVLHAG
jgi:hypothetical protein